MLQAVHKLRKHVFDGWCSGHPRKQNYINEENNHAHATRVSGPGFLSQCQRLGWCSDFQPTAAHERNVGVWQSSQGCRESTQSYAWLGLVEERELLEHVRTDPWNFFKMGQRYTLNTILEVREESNLPCDHSSARTRNCHNLIPQGSGTTAAVCREMVTIRFFDFVKVVTNIQHLSSFCQGLP